MKHARHRAMLRTVAPWALLGLFLASAGDAWASPPPGPVEGSEGPSAPAESPSRPRDATDPAALDALVLEVLEDEAKDRRGPASTPVQEDFGARPFEFALPTWRLMFGGAWLGARDDIGAKRTSGFAFDMKLGGLLTHTYGAGLMFWPEVGYSYGDPPRRARHLVTLGFGLHYGTTLSSVGWTPALVIGSENKDVAVGVRNSLIARWTVFSVELSHTWTSVGRGDDQEIRLSAGIDLTSTLGLALLYLLGARLGSS